MEEYKKCFEDYEISNFGNCRKKKKSGAYIIIKGSINNKGYRYFQVQRDGKRINNLFHHMVAKCFLGDRPENLVIDHIDRNPLNNNVENLRYITQRDNMRNTVRYRDDIEETDSVKRRNILSRDITRRIRESEIHHCSLCNLNFCSKKKLHRHFDGYRHKLKQSYKNEMEKYNIEWNERNYKLCKEKVYKYNTGNLISEPLVYVSSP